MHALYPKWLDVFSLIPLMNWLDWLLVSYILVAMLLGFWRGLVKEVFALLTWSVAITIALNFTPKLSNLLIHLITFPNVRLITSLLTLFMITMILFGWFCDLVIQSMRLSQLSFTERFLGVIFGGVRGYIALFFIVILGSLTQLTEISDWKQSLLMQHLGQVAHFVVSQLPSEFITQLHF